MTRPRILFLHEDLRRIGGGESMLLRLASIARERADVELALLFRSAEPLPAEFARAFDDVQRFDFPLAIATATTPQLWSNLVRLRRHVRARAPRLCIAFSYPAAFRMALAARGTALLWCCTLLVDTAGLVPHLRRSAAVRLIAARRVTALCPSDAVTRDLAGLGFPRRRLRVLRHGVDVDRFASAAMDAAARRDFRRRHDIPDAELVVTCVARIDPLKNHALLLRAVQRARDKGVRVAAVCIGGVDARDARYAEALRDVARALDVEHLVRWVGHCGDVSDWLAASDAAILPSISEAASLALLEAAAAGLPLLATNVGGNPEIVVPGRTGVLFGPDDVEACATALVRLAHDEAERRRLGAGAQQLAQDRHRREATDAAWTAFLSRRLSAPASRG